MKRLAVAASALLFSVAGAAADDPVAVRQALMQAVAASAGASAGMMKGEIEYNPVVAKAAIASLYGASEAFGDYFPDGSQAGETEASPKIWEDMAGFQQAVQKFRDSAASAMQAAGQNGPADLAAFQQAIQPVLANCRDCHQSFRVQKN